jgi:hypothetical protein
MSSFQVEGRKPSELLVPTLDPVLSKSGVLRTLDIVEGCADVWAEKPGTAALALFRSCGPVVFTSGVQRLKSVAQRRCSLFTYLFSVTRVEMPSVTACRSWKSRSLDVPTTLQNTTKNGQSGYESMVLGAVSHCEMRCLTLCIPSQVGVVAFDEMA